MRSEWTPSPSLARNPLPPVEILAKVRRMSGAATTLLANETTGRFYDRVGWLYPLVDVWMAAGRQECMARINREPAGELLEIGVGPGTHLAAYAGHRVSGIDVSASMVEASRRRCPACRIWRMDGERTGWAEGRFDIIALFHVLSVTADPGRLLAEAHRLLRPGGRMYILNRESEQAQHGLRVTGWMIVARWLRLRPRFRLDECPEAQFFHVVDRWSYGPTRMFTGTLLQK